MFISILHLGLESWHRELASFLFLAFVSIVPEFGVR